MDDDTQKIIREQWQNLPERVRAAISSVDLRDRIKIVGEKNALHIDQVGILENETILVMLGIELITDYAENIRRELSLTQVQASGIVKDVNDAIFSPIRDELKNFEREPEENVPGPAINNGIMTTAIPRTTTLIVTPPIPTQPQPAVRTPQPIPPRPTMPVLRPVAPASSMTPAAITSKPQVDLWPTAVKPTIPQPTQTVASAPAPKPELKIPKDFMEQALAGDMSIPTQNISVQKSPEPAVRKSTVDPYREPIR